jgi:uncharacterized lipoprotein YddW (UPF0748 family)
VHLPQPATFLLVIGVVTSGVVSPGATGAQAVPAADAGIAPTAIGASRGEVRALWVVRDSLTSPESVSRVVQHAVASGFNTLFVQVRGRGDAYFNGGVEPRAQALASQPASFDPLSLAISAAHRAGLTVHAWVAVNLVASAATLPSSRDHVINRHPEWLMIPRSLAQEFARSNPAGPGYVGRLARWTRIQPDDVEGLYLSPVVPAAATYTVSVLADLVRRYPIDGLHLDYIRFPGPEFDYSRAALNEFARTMAPTVPSPQRARLNARAKDDVLAWADAYPSQWADFRRSRLTALLMKIRTAVRAARPNIVMSAAVFPDMNDAYATRFQDWRLWAESGLLNVLCPMAYTVDLAVFKRQIAEAVQVTSPALVWAGIGAYHLAPAQTVAHIEAARALGVAGVALFSYDTIAGRSTEAYFDTLRRAAFGPPANGQDQEP